MWGLQPPALPRCLPAAPSPCRIAWGIAGRDWAPAWRSGWRAPGTPFPCHPHSVLVLCVPVSCVRHQAKGEKLWVLTDRLSLNSSNLHSLLFRPCNLLHHGSWPLLPLWVPGLTTHNDLGKFSCFMSSTLNFMGAFWGRIPVLGTDHLTAFATGVFPKKTPPFCLLPNLCFLNWWYPKTLQHDHF